MRRSILWFAFLAVVPCVAAAAPGEIELTSGNASLQDSFAWAKGWALELVVPANARRGDNPWMFHDKDQRVTQYYPFEETNPGPEWSTDPTLSQYSPSVVGSQPKPTIPAYWGTYAYPEDSTAKGWWQWSGGRECFCTRDICHQAVAGHLLGLDTENWSMLHAFAKGANENTRNAHWPKWSYSFFGDPYYMDGDWRELPAPLELGEKLYEQYLWTGNSDYINNPDILTYHANLHSEAAFMSHQDVNHNGIADETIQLPTLWEDTHDDFIEAGDSVGCQYQAMLGYAGVLEARGDTANAAVFRSKAAALRQKFNDEWYNPESQRYIRGYREDGTWKDNWGHEGSFFMPMKLVTDQGPRTAAYIDFIFRSAYEKELNIEAKTYLPEMLYKQGRDGMGWHYLAEVMNSRNRYPEVAFTTISNTVCGLMGVRVDAPAGRVTTLPHLTHQVPWVECNHIKAGSRDIKLRHDGRTSSTLTLNAGASIVWTAQFPGAHAQIKVNGVWRDARREKESGQIVSAVDVMLSSPGQIATAEVNGDASVVPLGDLTPLAVSGTIQRDGLPGSSRPMMVAGKFVERAVSMRGDDSSVSYDLSHAPCVRFTADLGVDDSAAADNAVEFIILMNDEVAYRSGPVVRGQRKPVELALAGCRKLQLKITAGTSSTALVANALLHRGVQVADESAASVAAGLRMPAIAKDARQLPMPVVPAGFTVALEESSDAALVSPTGVIAPPELDTLINLTFKITKSADGSTALGGAFTTTIPARTPDTAALAAKFIKSVPAPVHGQTRMTLPQVPEGFTIRMVESSDLPVIALDGSIQPPVDYRTVTLIYEVTLTSDGSTARTSPIMVVVPARDYALIDKLTWTRATSSVGEPAKGISYSGNALRLAGVTYDSGIGTHANSEIIYQLDGRYARMEALVGLDDAQRDAGSVQFEILGDGRSLAKTGILRGTADNSQRTANMVADLTGVQQLVLRVDDAGDGINSDHADWVNGKLFIAANPGNDAPVFSVNPISRPNALPGNAYAATIAGAASDVNGDALTYSKVAGPGWLRVSADGSLSGTPTSSDRGNQAWTVRVTDGSGAAADAVLNINVVAPSFSFNWSSADIGSVGVAGSASESGGTFTLSGSGADIWYTADAFQFASASLVGDGEIRARVISQTNTDAWAKAGVMIRDGTRADAKNAMMTVTPGGIFTFQWRANTGETSDYVRGAATNPAPNNWVRLTRRGALLTGYSSADGVAWTQVGQVSISLAGSVQVGLAVTSHNNPVASTAVFDHVSVMPYDAQPLVTDDSAAANEDAVVAIAVLANDAAWNNGAGSVQSVTQGAHGGVLIDGDHVIYTPTGNWNGMDRFTYTANDGLGNSATASVTVTVNPVNDAPAFAADPINRPNAAPGSAYAHTIAGSASDVDGDALVYAKVAGPSWLNVGADGSLSGTPAAGDAGSHAWTVRVTDQAGAFADADLKITVAPPVQSNWTSSDIGSVGVAGQASASGGVFTLSGSGADIWDDADAFQFASTTLVGDGEIRARVTSQSGTEAWAKAGVMIREGSGAGAKNAMMTVTPVGIFTFQWRKDTDGASDYVRGTATNPAPDNWVRVTRSGSLITGYSSFDGVTWSEVGKLSLSLPSSVQVGLAVTSHNNSVANTASFDNVRVTPFPLPWQAVDVGTPGVQGSAEYFNSAFTLKGAGHVDGSSDHFRFAYQMISGDGEIRTRVRAMQNTGGGARLGVMIRNSLAAGSPCAFIGVNGAGDYQWLYRPASGQASLGQAGGVGNTPDIWLRLVRTGNSVSGYWSSNGMDWILLGSTPLTLDGNIYIGLVNASGAAGALNTTVFDSVTLEP